MGRGSEPSARHALPGCPQRAASTPTHPWPGKKRKKKPRPARQETSNQGQCFLKGFFLLAPLTHLPI